MADFGPAFERTIQNEGGFRLVNVSADRGGQTYAGIARNFHPNWAGWRHIDRNDLESPELSALVASFYKENFWDRIAGDRIKDQLIAESIFDFGVNAGWSTAARLAQIVAGTVPDGRIGPATLERLEQFDAATFVMKYSIAKIARYAEICNRDRRQTKFLLGWINRTMKGLV